MIPWLMVLSVIALLVGIMAFCLIAEKRQLRGYQPMKSYGHPRPPRGGTAVSLVSSCRWRPCPLDDRFKCALPGCVNHNICTARFDEEGV